MYDTLALAPLKREAMPPSCTVLRHASANPLYAPAESIILVFTKSIGSE